MPIVFAGAAAFEFGNVSALSNNMGYFDSAYALGAITKNSTGGYASAILSTGSETRLWVHARVHLEPIQGFSVGDTDNPVFTIHDENGQLLGGLMKRASQGYAIMAGGLAPGWNVVDGGVTKQELVDIDMAFYAFASNRILELYMDGVLIGRHSFVGSWVQPAQIRMAGAGNNVQPNAYSEIIVTSGDEPTLGWRLHSKRPDPSLPGLNTFDSGYWGALGNDVMTDGVVTTSTGARISGGFLAYTGPEEPLGIRGIMHSARYLKNGSDLAVRAMMRIDDTNYDTPDFLYVDNNRIMAYWEENPDTNLPFEVADFAGLQGGFRTILDS
jgi:hypothetical protein